jgi:hypothetical protein
MPGKPNPKLTDDDSPELTAERFERAKPASKVLPRNGFGRGRDRCIALDFSRLGVIHQYRRVAASLSTMACISATDSRSLPTETIVSARDGRPDKVGQDSGFQRLDRIMHFAQWKNI